MSYVDVIMSDVTTYVDRDSAGCAPTRKHTTMCSITAAGVEIHLSASSYHTHGGVGPNASEPLSEHNCDAHHWSTAPTLY